MFISCFIIVRVVNRESARKVIQPYGCTKAFDNRFSSKNLKPKESRGSIWPPPHKASRVNLVNFYRFESYLLFRFCHYVIVDGTVIVTAILNAAGYAIAIAIVHCNCCCCCCCWYWWCILCVCVQLKDFDWRFLTLYKFLIQGRKVGLWREVITETQSCPVCSLWHCYKR